MDGARVEFRICQAGVEVHKGSLAIREDHGGASTSRDPEAIRQSKISGPLLTRIETTPMDNNIKDFEAWLNQRIVDAEKIAEIVKQDFEVGLLTAYRSVKYAFDELKQTPGA
jgi:hypothetical protein